MQNKITDAIRDFILSLIKPIVKLVIEAALEPVVVEKFKLAYKQILSDGAINAAESGIEDEKSKEQIKEADLPDAPLPSKW